MQFLTVFVSLVFIAASLAYLFLRKRFSYWADRGVLHDQAHFIYGHLKEYNRTKPWFQPFREYYQKHKGRAPFVGMFLYMRPAILILDLDLLKNVLIKDFPNFSDRGEYYNEKDDPISAHLFNLDGPKWKTMRAKLSPTFTSGKMKFMYPTLVEVAEKFINLFHELVEDKGTRAAGATKVTLEVKELLARFTTDVIGTCAFGLECNSLKDPHTQFRLMGERGIQERSFSPTVFAILEAFPNISRKLGLKAVPDDVSGFFMNVVRESVDYREKNNVKRNDFLNMLIEMKKKNEMGGITIEEIAAQSFVFFLAGFETSSSTMGFLLYELAIHQEIQDKVRQEVNDTFERHEGQFTYEAMRELKYLHQVFNETLRKYPIVSIVGRKALNDYKVPNTSYVIEKGSLVLVPIDAIHHDPEIYPNPEVFDPERFSPSEIEKRSTVAWLPFGEGPRNCIGLRFGEMQATVGLAMLLRNFRFALAKDTPRPLEYDLKSIVLSSKSGIKLEVEAL